MPEIYLGKKWEGDGYEWQEFDTDPEFFNLITSAELCESCLRFLEFGLGIYADFGGKIINPAYSCWKVVVDIETKPKKVEEIIGSEFPGLFGKVGKYNENSRIILYVGSKETANLLKEKIDEWKERNGYCGNSYVFRGCHVFGEIFGSWGNWESEMKPVISQEEARKYLKSLRTKPEPLTS